MRSYSHLSEDERDQIGVLRAAGRSMDERHCPGARSGESHHLEPGAAAERTLSLWAGTRRFTPPEPINCAGGVENDPRTRGRLTSVRGGPARSPRAMDARTDLRLVEIRE